MEVTGIISAAGWTVAERVASVAGQMILFLAVARVVGPADFGLFAIASAFVMGLSCLAEAGWREYIAANAHDPDAVRESQSLAFGTSLAMTLVGGLAGAAVLLVPGRGDLGCLILALATTILPNTLCRAWSGLMIGTNRIVRLCQITIVADILGLVVGLTAVAMGSGVMSLFYSRFVSLSLGMALLILVTLPFPRLSLPVAGSGAIRFSSHMLVGRLIGWGRDNVGVFLLGAFFNVADAGIYRAASRLAGAVSEPPSDAARRLAWSGFARARREGGAGALARSLTRFSIETLALTAPVFVGLACTAGLVADATLGAEWSAVGPMLAILALARFLAVQGVLAEPSLSVAGHVHLVPRLALAAALGQVVGLIAAAPFGLIAVALADLVVSAVIFAATIWVERRFAALKVRAFLAGSMRPALAVALMAAFVLMANEFLKSWANVPRLVLLVVVGGAAWLTLMGAFHLGRVIRLARSLGERRWRPTTGWSRKRPSEEAE